MSIQDVCAWLESTWPALLVRESLYGFQIVVAAHLIGVTLSVGMLLWLDLRLLGAWARSGRISELYRTLAPWFFAGFALMFVSGGALLAAYAGAAYGNVFFRLKMAALLLAGVNALAFHRALERNLSTWDAAASPPPAARVFALASLVLWAAIIIAGRMMSYTMF